jgi:quinol-cytochrome oxidoreductase complex cytochrome b subunit/mono/diheme cytochrome c family protein
MSLLTWLDDRTGYKGLLRGALYEHIPGGARWRYVWGSTLVFVFAVQMITGVFLWMHYSPSSQTAWESVYYIQHEMNGGWLLRGIHHYSAQVMIILLALHLLQVIIDSAYRAPREFNFWIGLFLLVVTMGLALTGYLLPWDQKGYWSTKVATALMGVVPVVGEPIQRLVVGGPAYGHHTLTRFFALHAGVLPALLIAGIVAHVYVFRRHGITAKDPKRAADSYFWPDQVLRDAVACLAVLLFILFLCVRAGLFSHDGTLAQRFAHPGHLGAELTAPADPSEQYGAARPEWYFLFLFQFLKLPAFSAEAEVYGAVVIPSIVMGILFLMPLLGRWRVGHWFNVGFTIFLFTGIVLLTLMAIVEDHGGPRMSLPLLGRLGPKTFTALVSLMILAVLVLIPVFRRERSFKFTMATMGGLLLLCLIAVGIVVAGGGAAQEGPKVWLLGHERDVQNVVLLSLLGLLALLLTVVIFRDYPRAGEVALPAGNGGGRTYTGIAHEPGDVATDPGDANVAPAERAAIAGTETVPSTDPVVPSEPAFTSSPISLARWELHHRLRLGMLMAVIVGVTLLASISVIGSNGKPEYIQAVRQAKADADRIVALAQGPAGIPPVGAILLLRDDPKTQGPKLFAAHCAACHRYEGHDGRGYVDKENKPSAPDLGGFASRKWLTDLMNPALVDKEKFFGEKMVAHEGAMVEFVQTNLDPEELKKPKNKKDAADILDIIIALSAEAKLPAQRDADAAASDAIARGKKAFSASSFECTDCHSWYEHQTNKPGKSRGPDLTGYGSERWMVEFINNPAHPRFYGKNNDRMPKYGADKILTEKSITLVAKWLRGDWYEPGKAFEVVITQTDEDVDEFGEPVAAPTSKPSTAPASAPSSTPAPSAAPESVPAVPDSAKAPPPASAEKPAPLPAKPPTAADETELDKP